MAFVKRGHFTAAFQRTGGHDEVVVANHCSRRLKLGPETGVFVSRLLCVRNDGQRGDNRLQIFFPPAALRAGRALDAMPEFGHRDGRDFKFVRGARGQPVFQGKGSLLAADDDVRIEDYRHLSLGVVRDF